MAVVPITSKNSNAPVSVSTILLATSGDTLNYMKNKGQELYLFNTSNSAVTVTIDGSDSGSVVVPGTAGTTISVASGLSIPIAANSFAYLVLEKAEFFLQGTVAITASTGSVIRASVVTTY